ncbi:MAG: hypothetical protein GAK43_00776 [Stenotrophomonas maltophilia]|nr:MAG: hypothetical protein GAK43_00776 [Stenotrophomonas maltophilia]
MARFREIDVRTFASLLLLPVLAGCGSSVVQNDALTALDRYRDTDGRLVVAFQPDPSIANQPEWTRLQRAWRSALQREAASADMSLSEQTDASPTLKPATLLLVEVTRLHSDAEGEGWLRSDVRFTDGQSGRLYGSRRYETEHDGETPLPSALQKQVEDIAQLMVDEVREANPIVRREPIPASAPSSPTPPAPAAQAIAQASTTLTDSPVVAVESREQRLESLQQRNLPFEQYQTEYRRIMGQ